MKKRVFLVVAALVMSVAVAYATNVRDKMTFMGPVTISGALTTSGTVTSTGVATLTNPVFIAPALGTPASGVLTNTTGLPASSVLAGSFGAGAFVVSTSLQAATVELGHATDTTLSRVSAGLIAVEGKNVVDVSTAQTLTNKTLTSPKIGTSILDVNGTNLFTFSPEASAVNYWNFINTATGVNPTIKMLGTDTNISLSLNTKGTGTFNFQNQTATDDTIVIAPKTGGANYFAGTITSADLTAAKTWTFPDLTGTVGLTTNDLSIFAATTSAQLLGVLSNETGTGVAVFNDTPTLIAPLLGTPTSGVMTNVTGLPSAGMTVGAKTHTVSIAVPDPGAANADIAAGYVLWTPSVAVTITKVYTAAETAWVAAAAANDATVTVTNAAVGTVASLNVVSALAVGSNTDMGAITNASVVAGTNVTIAVTTNGTADAPRQNIQIEYTTVN